MMSLVRLITMHRERERRKNMGRDRDRGRGDEILPLDLSSFFACSGVRIVRTSL